MFFFFNQATQEVKNLGRFLLFLTKLMNLSQITNHNQSFRKEIDFCVTILKVCSQLPHVIVPRGNNRDCVFLRSDVFQNRPDVGLEACS